ncbi:MAG: translocation/assembly module TamB domain-containing protein [Pseudomonadota bacterium]
MSLRDLHKVTLAGLTAFSLTVLPAQAQDSDDEESGGRLVRFLEDTLSGDGRTINVVGLSGALSSRATIERLEVSDDEGVWFTLENAVLDWNRLALVRGRFSVNELSAERIVVARAPGATTSDDTAPAPEATPFQVPELPVAINISQIAIREIDLGEALIGTPAQLGLDGNLSLESGALDARLDLQRLDRDGDEVLIATSFSNETRMLDLDLQVTESPGGLLGTIISLPGNPSIDLDLQGDGPLSAFDATLALKTDDDLRFGGDITLQGLSPEENQSGDVEQGPLRFSANLGGDIRPLLPEEFHDFFGPETRILANGQRDPDGATSVEALRISAEALSLDGALDLSAEGAIDTIVLQGGIQPPTGNLVVLPVPGQDTTVKGVTLAANFDASAGRDWTLDLEVTQLASPDFTLASASVTGAGQSTGPESEDLLDGQISADLTGLDLSDVALAQAVGDSLSLTGNFRLIDAGELILNAVTFTGAGLDATADATLDGLYSGLRIEAEADLTVADISRFETLANAPLKGALQASVSGYFVPLSGAFDVDLTGTAQDLEAGIEQVDPLLTGQTNLALQAVRDETGVTLRNFNIDGTAITADAQGNLSSSATSLTFNAAIDDLARVLPQLPGAGQLTGEVDQMGSAYVGNVSLTAPNGINLIADGRYEQGASEARIQGGLDDLGVFVPQMPGKADLSGNVTQSGDDFTGTLQLSAADGSKMSADGTYGPGKTNGRLDATVMDLGIFVPQMPGQADVTGRVREDDNGYTGTLQVRAADGSTVVADASYDTAIKGTVNAVLTNLGLFVPQLPGQATVTADVSQAGQAYDATLQAQTADGSQITADGTYEDGKSNGTFSAALTDLGVFVSQLPGRATVNGTVNQDGEAIAGTVQARLANGSTANARGTYHPEETEGTFTATLADLGTFVPQMPGPVTVSGDVKQNGTAYDGTVQARSANGSTANAKGSYGPDVLKATFDAALADLGVFVPQMVGRLTASGDVTQDGDAYTGSLRARAADGSRVDANGTYGAGQTKGQVQADIVSLEAFVPQMPGSATLSAQVEERDNAYRGQVNARTENGSTLTAQGAYGDSEKTVTFDALLAEVGAFVGQVAGNVRMQGSAQEQSEGTYAAKVTMDGTAGIAMTADGQINPQGASNVTYDATIARVERLVPDFPGTLRSQGKASRNADVWTIDSTTTGPAGINASVAGSFNQSSNTADITARGEALLAAANAFISPMAIDGPVNFDLRLNGAPALDAVSGTVSLPGSRVAIPQIYGRIEPLTGQISMSGGSAQVDLRGQWADGGSFTVAGPVALSAPFRAGVNVGISNLVLTDQALYRTLLDGQISMEGPLAGNGQISGVINVGTTELNIAASAGGAGGSPIPTIEHVGETQASYQTRERAGLIADEEEGEGGGGPAYGLNVTISAPNQIFVRGRGLDAELGGGLSLRGTTANIVPVGQINLIRGRLDIVGRRLELDRGQVTLQGSFEPYIDFEASNTSSAGTATIQIFGPIQEPEVEVTSDPERPAEEALGLLIFGDQFANLSPLKIAQLASSLAVLTGQLGADGGILGSAREGLGAASLDLTTDEDGNAQVGVGAYLSEEIYTDVTVNTEGRTELNLNLDLTKRITAKGRVDSEGNSALGLYYTRDF